MFFLILPTIAWGGSLDQLESQINSWRIEDARKTAEKIGIRSLEESKAKYLLGKLLFFEGKTDEAVSTLREAIEGNRAEIEWKGLRDRAQSTGDVFSTLTLQAGRSGRFTFRYAKHADDILVGYADDTLNKQLQFLEKTFDNRPTRPIDVIFVQDAAALSAVSGLSVEQIERTGTVGITKYGRIMLITPRNLVTGYPWLDTLAHELTHFIITRVSQNKAPVWLHEGVAKLLERRWRSPKLQDLTPEEAYLLDRAVKEGRLIPLRRFHPSVAYLSDQEEAVLAYAEVLSFLRYMNSRMPENWLKSVLSGLGMGRNINGILVDLSGANLGRLFMWWRKKSAGRQHTPMPAVGLLKRQFKRGAMANNANDSLHALDVRRHLRLGDLLRLRGHIEGAVSEFTKAKELASFLSPEISDRLAASLLELGKFDQVIKLLEPIVALYPSHPTAYIQLAKALSSRNALPRAVTMLKQANAINPFDPDIHCLLTNLYYETDKQADAATEKALCQTTLALTGKKLK